MRPAVVPPSPVGECVLKSPATFDHPPWHRACANGGHLSTVVGGMIIGANPRPWGAFCTLAACLPCRLLLFVAHTVQDVRS